MCERLEGRRWDAGVKGQTTSHQVTKCRAEIASIVSVKFWVNFT